MLNKKTLVRVVARESGIPLTTAQTAVDVMFDALVDAVKYDGGASIQGFGKFQPQKRAARTGRNPHINQPVYIPPCTTVKFTPSLNFKNELN